MVRILKLGIFCCLIFVTGGLQAQEDQMIKSIYFGGGSWYIDGEQLSELYQFVDSIPDLDQYEIIIHSHTDNIGGAAFNEWLSQMRSESVYNKLILKDIPPDKMFIRDFGLENPLYDNSTLNGRLHNRRVDVIIQPLVM